MYQLCRNFIFTLTVLIFQLSPARVSVGASIALSNTSSQDHDVDLGNVTQGSPKCVPLGYEVKDVIRLRNNDLLLKLANITLPASEYKLENETLFACLTLHPRTENLPALNCPEKFIYENYEFLVLPNGSAVVGKYVVPAGEYELDRDNLLTCVPEEDAENDATQKITLQKVSIYVGHTGSAISIVSLVMHLFAFAFVPSFRNLNGYNLASLSVAFLFAYSWVLIGQIPQVLGHACVVSAVLQQNFFLTAFFCMNVLAFDVFRMLKSATERLVPVGSRISNRRQFLCYSVYAWGTPAVITTISVIVENSEDVSEDIKPGYGKRNMCVMASKMAKVVFFAVPAFTLILVNVVFFLMSAWIISSNAMKVTKDQTKQNLTVNYFLYLRLAIMMGMTWLVGIIAIITSSDVVWFVSDLLNSLQGLFLFLLFTCSRKVLKHIVRRSSTFRLYSTKRTTLTSISSSKTDSSGAKLSRNNSLA